MNVEMALVGGVNYLIHPTVYIGLSQLGMLSPDGRCKVFNFTMLYALTVSTAGI
jgi:acyl transferase domain-containing protein